MRASSPRGREPGPRPGQQTVIPCTLHTQLRALPCSKEKPESSAEPRASGCLATKLMHVWMLENRLHNRDSWRLHDQAQKGTKKEDGINKHAQIGGGVVVEIPMRTDLWMHTCQSWIPALALIQKGWCCPFSFSAEMPMLVWFSSVPVWVSAAVTSCAIHTPQTTAWDPGGETYTWSEKQL